MFGLIRPKEGKDETKEPGFIKTAALFRSKEEQENVNQMERDAKEMAKNFDGKATNESALLSSTPNSMQQRSMKLTKSGNISVSSYENLGPLEKKTK